MKGLLGVARPFITVEPLWAHSMEAATHHVRMCGCNSDHFLARNRDVAAMACSLVLYDFDCHIHALPATCNEWTRPEKTGRVTYRILLSYMAHLREFCLQGLLGLHFASLLPLTAGLQNHTSAAGVITLDFSGAEGMYSCLSITEMYTELPKHIRTSRLRRN
jgi:hypothetical protein